MKQLTLWACILAILLSIAQTSASHASLGLKGIGGKLAFVSPDGVDSTVLFGVVADLGTIVPLLGAEASIDYQSKSTNSLSPDSSLSRFAINGTAKYEFPVPGAMTPFAAGGLSIFRSSTDIAQSQTIGFPGIGTSSAPSNTEVGLHFGGGIDYALSSLVNLTIGSRLTFAGPDTIQIVATLTYSLR